MPITPKEPTATQLAVLARAQAVTLEQVELAKDIVATKFRGLSAEVQCNVAAMVTQALATNYLAECTRLNQPK